MPKGSKKGAVKESAVKPTVKKNAKTTPSSKKPASRKKNNVTTITKATENRDDSSRAPNQEEEEEVVDRVDARSFSHARLRQLYKKLSGGAQKLETDAFLELIDKLGYDISEAPSLVLCFLLDVAPEQSAEPCVEETVFVEVLSDRGIDSLSKLKAQIKNGPGNANWPEFYEYVFKMSRDTPTHKYIDLDTALSVLPIAFEVVQTERYPQYTKFIGFLEMLKGKTGTGKAPTVSEDVWLQLPKFLSEFRDENFSDYDPAAPWPTMIDDMVEWVQEK